MLTQGQPFIMVTTGMRALRSNQAMTPSRDSDVINIKSACRNFPVKFPKRISGAVAMRHEAKMVVCSGYPMTSDCYSYSNNSWNREAFKMELTRFKAMSVEIRPGEWLIMGGSRGRTLNTMTSLRGSSFFRNGSFHLGFLLPEPIGGGSSVMLNETHVFIAAGYNNSEKSSKNYLFNINAKKWTRIADRTLKASTFHSSGTFMNFTEGEIQVANIGASGIEVYSPKINSWHQGLTDIKIIAPATIQRGTDSFMLIGGTVAKGPASRNGGFTSDVYLFDENGLRILKENALHVPRAMAAAMTISEEDFTCEQRLY